MIKNKKQIKDKGGKKKEIKKKEIINRIKTDKEQYGRWKEENSVKKG